MAFTGILLGTNNNEYSNFKTLFDMLAPLVHLKPHFNN